MNEPKYKLARGARVREEGFGLLFYTMHGPRLYFVASGDLLREEFFQGHISLETWIDKCHPPSNEIAARIPGLKKSLEILADKGVIIEC
jgi:putative mycofactocin binding protein MftB